LQKIPRSFSPTGQRYPQDANSASCRLRRGGLATSSPSIIFLLTGLGWGGMPLHAVRKDLEEGRLSVLPIEDVPPDGLMLTMSAVWQTKLPPVPAGRWFVDRLKQMPLKTGKVPKPPVARKKARRSAKT
jgi:DNA-binding transcriptional LysR family regulator